MNMDPQKLARILEATHSASLQEFEHHSKRNTAIEEEISECKTIEEIREMYSHLTCPCFVASAAQRWETLAAIQVDNITTFEEAVKAFEDAPEGGFAEKTAMRKITELA